MAGRNNPLINWLNCSFDTFNLLHRWFGRIVVLEAVTHVSAWIAGVVAEKGWSAAGAAFQKPFYTFGLLVSNRVLPFNLLLTGLGGVCWCRYFDPS